MDKLQWTTERPTEYGWYWLRSRADPEPGEVFFSPARIVLVRRLDDGRLVPDFATMEQDPWAKLGGALWAGPIPEPKDQTP